MWLWGDWSHKSIPIWYHRDFTGTGCFFWQASQQCTIKMLTDYIPWVLIIYDMCFHSATWNATNQLARFMCQRGLYCWSSLSSISNLVPLRRQQQYVLLGMKFAAPRSLWAPNYHHCLSHPLSNLVPWILADNMPYKVSSMFTPTSLRSQ